MKKQICVILGALTLLSFTGCNSEDLAKPAKINTISADATIADAAKTFAVTEDEFQAYLDLNELTWDDFVANLNDTSSTFESLKEDMENNFAEDEALKNATAADYIRYNLTESPENNAEIDESKYKEIKTLGGRYKVYFANKDVNKFDVISEENSTENEIINTIAQYGTNPAYMLTAIESFHIDEKEDIKETHHSVEFIKSFVIKGNSGKILTEDMEKNPFFSKDYIYTYDDDKELKETAVANIIGIYNYDNNNTRIEKDDVYLLYVSNFGLLLKSDDYKKLMELSDMDIQVRYQIDNDLNNHNASETEETEHSDET